MSVATRTGHYELGEQMTHMQSHEVDMNHVFMGQTNRETRNERISTRHAKDEQRTNACPTRDSEIELMRLPFCLILGTDSTTHFPVPSQRQDIFSSSSRTDSPVDPFIQRVKKRKV